MRVFVDTNVWLAALRARGLCADLLEWLLDHETLLTSEVVIDEVKEKLGGKFALSAASVRAVEGFMRQQCEIVARAENASISLDDPDGIPILVAAKAGGASVFVTGDRLILDLADVEGMRLLSPRAFWNAFVT